MVLMPADKILVVDDERLVRWSLRQKCEEWGFQVIEAEAGEPGLKVAQKLGAYDFVGKPLDFDELHVTIKNALEASRLRSEVRSLRGQMKRGAGYHEIVSTSPKMAELMNFVRKVASSEATTILIQG